MKNTLIILSFFFCYTNLTQGQNEQQVNKIVDFSNVFQSNFNVYSLNKTEFETLISESEKSYHLVYSFATWCKPCLESLPKVLYFIKNNPNVQLYILNIEKHDSKRQMDVKNFLYEKYNYTSNTFTVSEEYGKGKWKRYDTFINAIAPNHKEYGMSLFLLFSDKSNLIYASTYNETTDEILKLIEKKVKTDL